MFSTEKRCKYAQNQLADVICQLRFPDILSINATEPAEFQEMIRSEYPQYAKQTETPAPKIVGAHGSFHIEPQPSTPNYLFKSADGLWQINLTSRFISITCKSYSGWEEFARKFDMPLAAFIKVYKPAYFHRIGLRYLNFISRQALGLENVPFSELIEPMYLGLMADETTSERSFQQNSVDAEVAIKNGCRLKMHAGPGIVKRNGHTDQEVKFIIDQDLFIGGNVPVNQAAESLETLHAQAFPIFRGAITDILHDAMRPEEI